MKATYREWRAAYDDLHSTLVSEQDKRATRRGVVCGEPEWVAAERDAMVDRVNLLRSRRGLWPLAVTDIRAKEDLACGHSDYTEKYAIGCADLVVAE